MLQWCPIRMATGLHASVSEMRAFGPLADCSADPWTLSQDWISTQQRCPRVWDWQYWTLPQGKAGSSTLVTCMRMTVLALALDHQHSFVKWAQVHHVVILYIRCIKALFSNVDPWQTAVETFGSFPKPKLNINSTTSFMCIRTTV